MVVLGRVSPCCFRPFGSVSRSSGPSTPFPLPAHRTGHADLPHPALGPGSFRRHARCLALAWPSDIASVAASGSSRALLDSSSIASIPCCSVRTLEPGPLPSTGITRLQRYYEPLRHPLRPGARCVCWPNRLGHRSGLPVLPAVPCWHAVTHHPGEADRTRRPVFSGPCQPSPSPGRVGLRIVSFGAASVFTHVTACQLADSPKLPLFSQASAASLPPRPLG